MHISRSTLLSVAPAYLRVLPLFRVKKAQRRWCNATSTSAEVLYSQGRTNRVWEMVCIRLGPYGR